MENKIVKRLSCTGTPNTRAAFSYPNLDFSDTLRISITFHPLQTALPNQPYQQLLRMAKP
ncbi:hypothetical protein phig1ep59 [Lactobacillus phage phig1e]|uniref:hypothetical protein n=1 Tax=Lactobacillus phage phig1e TaxID=52979 RepID=UPI0001B1BBEF|nr:hypothetical protein phig1ep59 [Lactobacillus phage phig1e]